MMLKEEEEEEASSRDLGAKAQETTKKPFEPIEVSYDPIFPQLGENKKAENAIKVAELKEYLYDTGFQPRKSSTSSTARSRIDSSVYELFDEDYCARIQRREEFYTASDLKELPQ